MTLKLDDGFFQRAEALQLENCQQQLAADLQTRLEIDAQDPLAVEEYQRFFAGLWDEATGEMQLVDCVTIAKYFNIRLTQDRWQQSRLHRSYVEAMLTGEDDFVRVADGIWAIHQNILEQHYAK